MKLRVRFYEYAGHDEMKKVGTAYFDGKNIIWKVENNEDLKEPFHLNGKEYHPEKNPEEFLKRLHLAYSGTYFYATKARPVDEDGDEGDPIEVKDEEDNEKIEKDLFGSIHETTAETENQVTAPEPVDGVKEQASKTPQVNNSEPIFSKSELKPVLNNWFYDTEDGESLSKSLTRLKIDLLSFAKSMGKSEDLIQKAYSSAAEILIKSDSLYEVKKELEKWLEEKDAL